MNKTIEEKLESGRQYRAFAISADNLETRDDEGNEAMIVKGHATIFNTPYLLADYGDVKIYEQVDARAFDEADMADVIMQYNHEGRVFARKSNGTLRVGSDEIGLAIVADLGGTTIGRQLYEEIKGGYTNKMSFGFTVAADERKESMHKTEEGLEIYEILRTITKIGKLYDVSAVSIPANDATDISARAYCEGVYAEAAEELRTAQEAARRRQDNINKIKIIAEVTK